MQVLAEIITIGDEILIGQIVDTNSAWIAQELNLRGIRVKQISSVSDNREHIIRALNEASERADIIIITGGLGPTKDDITKHTLFEYFGGKLTENQEQLNEIFRIFSSYGREVSPLNRKQAEVPDNCTCIVNKNGTAPGMWFEKNAKVYVSMPGVPREMKEMMKSDVLLMLSNHFKTPAILHRTFLTQGVGESILAEWIAEWENALPEHIKLAYLPSQGQVRLRLSGFGKEANVLEREIQELSEKLYDLIGEHIYGEGEDTLAKLIHAEMIQKKITLSLAESCTGGNIAHQLTLIPGSSEYFQGGAIVYSNELKTSVLGVHQETLHQYGAVSEQVVKEMALGALQKFDSDISLAITGIAGPGGGTEEKPVGTVWIAIASAKGVISKKYRLGQQREVNITVSTLSAMFLLKKYLRSF